MLPVIVIVGRPNVGKSTLFNCLTRSRNAIVADTPGLTRDRQYGEGEIGSHRFIIVDTGGIGTEADKLAGLTLEQTKQALQEADAIVFVVDAKSGRTAGDETIAAQVRLLKKPLTLVVNKVDGIDPNLAMIEFFALGLGQPFPVAAAHGQGVTALIDEVMLQLPKTEESEEKQVPKGIKVAIVGRPNVGKSTLVNRMLGEARVIVSEEAGTTRDSIYIPFTHHGEDYVIIDTAGMRRRSKVTDKVEKFSTIKTLQAIEAANVVIFVVDGTENIADQDLKLLGFILEAGKAIVIAINKWDGLAQENKDMFRHELARRLTFLDFVSLHFISALHGSGVGNLFDAINKTYQAACKMFSTNKVTKTLLYAVNANQPPLSHGQRIKLRYAHQGGKNPPVFVIHGNQTEALPDSYLRYLSNYFRRSLKLWGTPIRIQLKNSTNPFKDSREKKPVARRSRHKR